jgi:serine/threonine protein kinase
MPPPSSAASRLSAIEEETARPGEEIVDGSHRYVLVKRLPGGGLGEVWVADQVAPVRRRVAIKFIRSDKYTKANEARFENERRVLASFDHPNIARFFDAGRHRERPWFAMEYVEGLSIDLHCERNGLTVPERIRLVQQVAGAVQYAHDREIVHRDIKPGNVLVTAEGVPKLLDFGIAKIVGTKIDGHRGITTDFEPHTEEYASPEQLRAQPSTVRSDVYALGVMLYELLTEQLPYHVKTRVRERVREIKLKEPPPPMSEALEAVSDEEPPPEGAPTTGGGTGTVGAVGSPPTGGSGSSAGSRSRRRNLSKRLAEIARRRNTRPDRLIRSLRGDLDNIVAKAMRIEPLRRYASPASLAADLENHLQGLPVEARPESAAARLSRILVRNRWVVAGTLVTLVALAGVLAASFLSVQNKFLASERSRLTAQREVLRRGLDGLRRLDDEIATSFNRDSGQTQRLRMTLEQLEGQAVALSAVSGDGQEAVDDLVQLADLRRRLAQLADSPASRRGNEGDPVAALRWLDASDEALGEAEAMAARLGLAAPKAARIAGMNLRERGDHAFHGKADIGAARKSYLAAGERFVRGIAETDPADVAVHELRRERMTVSTKLGDLIDGELDPDRPDPQLLDRLRAVRREVVEAYRQEVTRDPAARSRIDLSVGLQRLAFALTAGPGASDRREEIVALYAEALDVLRPELTPTAGAEARQYGGNAMLYLASAVRERMYDRLERAESESDPAAAEAARAAAREDYARIASLVEEAASHFIVLSFRAPEEELSRENLLRLQQGYLPGLPIERAFPLLDRIRTARLAPDGLVFGQLSAVSPKATLDFIRSPVTRAIFIGNGARMAIEWRSEFLAREADPSIPPTPDRLSAHIADALRDSIALARSIRGEQGKADDPDLIRLRIEAILCLAVAAQPFADSLLVRPEEEREALHAECEALVAGIGEPDHPIMAGEAGVAWGHAKREWAAATDARRAFR